MGVSREKLAKLDVSLLDKRPEELTPNDAAGLARAIACFQYASNSE